MPAAARGGRRAFGPDGLPVLVIEDAPEHLLYALPSMRALGADLEDGVKFARHHGGVVRDDRHHRPHAVRRRRRGHRRRRARATCPGCDPMPVRSAVCCYTNTPDGHFVVDRHPGARRRVVVSACSGHGFKFAPVVGAIAADFVDDVNVHGNLAPFAFRAV